MAEHGSGATHEPGPGDLPAEVRTPGYAAGIRAAARLIESFAGEGFDGIIVDRDLDVCDEIVERLIRYADTVDDVVLTDPAGQPVDWEYGIRRIGDTSTRIHRSNMTKAQAAAFMEPGEWHPLPVARVFEVVRRRRGEWQKVDL